MAFYIVVLTAFKTIASYSITVCINIQGYAKVRYITSHCLQVKGFHMDVNRHASDMVTVYSNKCR